jgi:integrase
MEGAYVKLLILLAPRKSALALMKIGDLKFDASDNPVEWVAPFELTKSRKIAKAKEYRTPLPALAQRILKGILPRGDRKSEQRVFASPSRTYKSGRETFTGGTVRYKLKEHGAPSDFSYHAWRHTVATWLQNVAFRMGAQARAKPCRRGRCHVALFARPSDGFEAEAANRMADHVEGLVQPAKGVTRLR